MAWRIFSSSWPPLTSTVTPGLAASKSLTTDWIACSSRSVKKCQKVIWPVGLLAFGGGAWELLSSLDPHPLSASAATTSDTVARRRYLVDVIRVSFVSAGASGHRRRGSRWQQRW